MYAIKETRTRSIRAFSRKISVQKDCYVLSEKRVFHFVKVTIFFLFINTLGHSVGKDCLGLTRVLKQT